MPSSLKLIHSGFQSGIEYSILNYVNQAQSANYHAKQILFNNGKCWATETNPNGYTGDMITIDMGYVHAVTALEIKNGVGPGACAGRSTKHARIHGSENMDGPWTVLLDKNWDPDPDPYPDPHTPATMEVYTVNETRARFLKLEIVEATGQHNVPAWEYLRARTGEKILLFHFIRSIFSADQAENSKFTGPSITLAKDPAKADACSSECSIFKKQAGFKAAKCATTDCPALRRRRATELEDQIRHDEKRSKY